MTTSSEILARVKDTLATAKYGLRDAMGSAADRRLGGLRNLVVFGRAVTNVLQGLRSTEPTFDAWYARFVKEMEGDPLLKYFYRIRSEILKKGVLGTGSSAYIKSFSYPEDLYRLGPPPPGAKGFFMGDQAGGSGWEIVGPDGQIEKLYVDIPGDIAQFTVLLPDAPLMHLGRDLADRRIETLASAYFEYLDQLVGSAERAFGMSDV
jgi:hypothetical protein